MWRCLIDFFSPWRYQLAFGGTLAYYCWCACLRMERAACSISVEHRRLKGAHFLTYTRLLNPITRLVKKRIGSIFRLTVGVISNLAPRLSNILASWRCIHVMLSGIGKFSLIPSSQMTDLCHWRNTIVFFSADGYAMTQFSVRWPRTVDSVG